MKTTSQRRHMKKKSAHATFLTFSFTRYWSPPGWYHTGWSETFSSLPSPRPPSVAVGLLRQGLGERGEAAGVREDHAGLEEALAAAKFGGEVQRCSAAWQRWSGGGLGSAKTTSLKVLQNGRSYEYLLFLW